MNDIVDRLRGRAPALGVANRTLLDAAADEIERLRILAYSHLGDNHHNARDCPYCQGKSALTVTQDGK